GLGSVGACHCRAGAEGPDGQVPVAAGLPALDAISGLLRARRIPRGLRPGPASVLVTWAESGELLQPRAGQRVTGGGGGGICPHQSDHSGAGDLWGERLAHLLEVLLLELPDLLTLTSSERPGVPPPRPCGPASDTAGEDPQCASQPGPRDHVTMGCRNGEFCARLPV
ncbi:MAG: hypothetical protein ACRDOE_01870, partial [Streptosporangiaceae bacterium]